MENDSVEMQDTLAPPKRPKSAWLFYTIEQRDKVIAEFENDGKGTLSMTEVVKELGDRYRNKISLEEKNKYAELAHEDKERYLSELQIYKAQNTSKNLSSSTIQSSYELIVPLVCVYMLLFINIICNL